MGDFIRFVGGNVFVEAVENLAKVIGAAERGAELALPKVGAMLVSDVKRKVSQHGSGMTYGNHQASAPGEPPAVDTGRYRSSWNFRTGPRYVEIGTADKRGPWLEFGTRNMAPRPHLRPVVEEARQKVTDMFAEVIVATEERAIATFRKSL